MGSSLPYKYDLVVVSMRFEDTMLDMISSVLLGRGVKPDFSCVDLIQTTQDDSNSKG